MTFAATAEVVRYRDASPLLVDCDPVTLHMDLADAERKIEQLHAGQTPLAPALRVVGIIPVHVGGLMMDMDEVQAFADQHGLWVVEDAAHSFPAAYRPLHSSVPGRDGCFRLAALWRKHGGGHLFLFLRQQDHDDRRGRHGRQRRCPAGGADAPDVAARTFA